MKGNGKNNRRTMVIYGAYNFRSKDPVIDELRTMAQDALGDVNIRTLKEIHNSGGPSVAAMVGWFHKGTLRPTNATIEAAGRALGKKRVWVKHK